MSFPATHSSTAVSVVSGTIVNRMSPSFNIWPRSNTTFGATVGYDIDQYQTWMGVKYAAFGNYTAGLEAAVLGNYNCNATDQLPRLAIGLYSE